MWPTGKSPSPSRAHAYGDLYKGTEYRVPGSGTATLSFKGNDGTEFSQTIYDFECPGVLPRDLQQGFFH